MKHNMKIISYIGLIILVITFYMNSDAMAVTRSVPSGYATIKAAINAAVSGDIIEVSPGQYNESITLKSGITLRGLNRQTTVINAAGTGKRAVWIPWQTTNVSISNLTIKGGIAEGTGLNDPYGGGIFVDGSTGITISNCNIMNNSSLHGGGVAIRNSSVSLKNNLITNNFARSTRDTNACQVSGGGIFIWCASLYNNQITVSGNQIFNNYSQVPVPPSGNTKGCYAVGGGLFHQLDTANANHNISISNNNFYANQASGAQHYGGGAYIYTSNNSQVRVTNNTFSNNNGLDGGGIAVIESNAAILNNRFYNNIARWGGGIYGWHMTSNIEGNIVNKNIASDDSCEGSYTTCSGGGGVLIDTSISDSTHTFKTNLVIENSADSWGGGIDLYAATYVISGNKITKNTATWGGGMLVNTDAGVASNPNVNNNLITENIAMDWGGGIGIGGAELAGQFRNNLIANNQAVNNTGGGIVISNAHPAIINNTIYSNLKGGIRADSSTPTIMNNIITNHSNTYGISSAGSTITLSYNDVWNNTTNYSGVSAGTGSISSDPIFEDTNDFYPATGSPCIDTGNPNSSYFDEDGSRNDMGRYGGSDVSPVITPIKIGIFKDGQWYLDYNGNGEWDGCGTTSDTDRCYTFGSAGDLPVVGDWDGTGKSEIGYFRNGAWYLDYNGNGVWDGCVTDRCIYFGEAGDKPYVGDWSGTGTSKIGFFRNGVYYFDYNGNGQWNGCGSTPDTDRCIFLGLASDTPFIGDWGGTGISKFGLFRNGVWYADYNGNGVWEGCQVDKCWYFGIATDTPIVADWNWTGFDKIGLFRDGIWYLDYNGSGGWEGFEIDRSYENFAVSGGKAVFGRW